MSDDDDKDLVCRTGTTKSGDTYVWCQEAGSAAGDSKKDPPPEDEKNCQGITDPELLRNCRQAAGKSADTPPNKVEEECSHFQDPFWREWCKEETARKKLEEKRQIALLQAEARCPASPPRGGAGWKRYDPSMPGNQMFHCGFEGYLETHDPSPDNPIAECFYDHDGTLVGRSHPYSGCRGTPDQYAQHEWWNHVFLDDGGIWSKGFPALLESMRHGIQGD